MKRTVMTFLAGAIVGIGGLALANHGHGDAKGPEVKLISSVDIDEEVGGKKSKVTTLEVTFAPGVAGLLHRHPGAIFGYVLEGELEFGVNDEKPRKLKTGDSFYEPAMALHSASKNPSNQHKTRILAIMVHPRDAKDLVIPEPAKKAN